MSQLDINLNVQNNVVLYKCENEKYFRNMRIFIIGQLIGWSILAVYAYTPNFFDIFTTDETLTEYIRNNMFRLSLFSLSFVIGKDFLFLFIISILFPVIIFICSYVIIFFVFYKGISVYLMIHLLCSRTVKYIVLNKGGRTLTIVTYNLWKKDCVMTVPTATVRRKNI